MHLLLRLADPKDSEAITGIYNQGIEDRIATFEVIPRSTKDIEKWFDGVHPIIVGEIDSNVIAFASTSTYRDRECYRGIAEFSVYVERRFRGMGIGTPLMKRLIEEAGKMGYWKLVSRIFVENAQSRALMTKLGFREVGVYQKHGTLDGEWKDVVIVELLIPDNLK